MYVGRSVDLQIAYPKDPVSLGATAVIGDVMRGRLRRFAERLMLPMT